MVNPGKKLKKILLILGITAAVYGGFRYLLPLVVPFLCAYGTALCLRPSVRYWERRICWKFRGKERHLPASVIGSVEIVLVLVILMGIFYLVSARLFSQAQRLTGGLLQSMVWLDEILTGLCRRVFLFDRLLLLPAGYGIGAVLRSMLRKLRSTVQGIGPGIVIGILIKPGMSRI